MLTVSQQQMSESDSPGLHGFSESFILGMVASLGGLISLVFASLRKSRCGNIDCCCGLFRCQRAVLSEAELAMEPPSPSHTTFKPSINNV